MSPISSRNKVPPEAFARDRGGVDGHEGLLGAFAGCMDGPGRELLAGATLSRDQDRNVAARHASDGLEYLEQSRALAHQPITRGDPGSHLATQLADLALQGAAAHGLGHQGLGLGHTEGLDQVVERSALHGLDGVLERVLGRHDHDRGRVRSQGPGAIQQLQTGGAGHANVEEGHVEGALGQGFQGGVARVDVHDLGRNGLQRLPQHEADAGLVVGHQNAGLPLAHAGLLVGSVTRARVPSPGVLSRSRVPPWRRVQ
jgi:hypothetical protein